MKKNNNKKDDDWFANVEQEIEKNKTTGVKSNETLEDSSLFGPSEPQQRKSKQSQKQHGTVYNKTQQFLSSKGVGWLMETVDQPASSTTNQENILGGDAAEQKQPSILEELDIDLYDIFWRVKQVLLTFREYDEETQRKLLLKDEGDFWGPFFIVCIFSCSPYFADKKYEGLSVRVGKYFLLADEDHHVGVCCVVLGFVLSLAPS